MPICVFLRGKGECQRRAGEKSVNGVYRTGSEKTVLVSHLQMPHAWQLDFFRQSRSWWRQSPFCLSLQGKGDVMIRTEIHDTSTGFIRVTVPGCAIYGLLILPDRHIVITDDKNVSIKGSIQMSATSKGISAHVSHSL